MTGEGETWTGDSDQGSGMMLEADLYPPIKASSPVRVMT